MLCCILAYKIPSHNTAYKYAVTGGLKEFSHFRRGNLTSSLLFFNTKPSMTMVPLNYNFIFTHVSMLHHACFAWKVPKVTMESFFSMWQPWLFHANTRGISWHVAFPRDQSWNFHESSSCGFSTRSVAMEFHKTSSRGISTRLIVMEFQQDQ